MNQFTASLWGDEAWAATLAVKPIWEIIKIVSHDTSPPLYYLFLHFWMKIFGTSEAAIRSLSFLFFLATAVVVFFIGRYLWDKKTGLLASFLTLVNPFLFIYAFEGRMYALLALTSTLSIYFFLRRQRWPFIFATTAALYTHHFSLFVIFWELLWRLKEIDFKKPKDFFQKFSDFLIIGLLYLPWVYPLYYQTSLVASGFWLGKPTIKTFFQTAEKFLVGDKKNIFRNLALGGVAVILLFRRWQKEKNTFFLLGWFFIPLVLTFIVSQFFQSIFFDRYMLMTIPAACLILASQRRKISNLFLGVVIACLLFNNYYYFTNPTKRPFRQLAEYIKKEAPQLTLINHNAAAHHLWESKYYGLKAPIYAPQPLPFYTGTALMEEKDVINTLPEEKELGVITSAPLEEVKIPGYHLIKSQQFGELKFLWMAKE
jgi:uncharacterized membrane protein